MGYLKKFVITQCVHHGDYNDTLKSKYGRDVYYQHDDVDQLMVVEGNAAYDAIDMWCVDGYSVKLVNDSSCQRSDVRRTEEVVIVTPIVSLAVTESEGGDPTIMRLHLQFVASISIVFNKLFYWCCRSIWTNHNNFSKRHNPISSLCVINDSPIRCNPLLLDLFRLSSVSSRWFDGLWIVFL